MKTYYREITREIVEGHRWICAGDILVSMAAAAVEVESYGGTALAVGARRGAGALADGVACLNLDVPPAGSMIGGIREGMAAIHALEATAVQAFDPACEARVLLPLYGEVASVAGRRVFGARREEWRALEDKTLIDAVWDAAGLRRAKRRIASLEWPEVWSAAEALDEGCGTAWVADNRDGWHGGAEGLRWVRSERDGRAALEELSAMADRVRVMPFLEGLPCSIHGFVLDNAVIALRPVEMIVLRRGASRRLHYAQAGSFWEPGAAVEQEMRSAVCRVGVHLRETVDYRGSFTLDGILTTGGFLPTELNPRYGGALSVLTRGIEGLWLYFLHLAMTEGVDVDWRPSDLETLLLEGSRSVRSAGGMAHCVRPLEPSSLRLRCASGAWGVVGEDELCDATVQVGPGPMGSIVLMRLDPERTPVGPSSAPRVASALRFLDTHLGLELGPLSAAPDVLG